MITPVNRVYPKLSIVPDPKIIKIPATAAVVTFPSKTDENARLYPFLTAFLTEFPFFNSSLILSLIIIFASTAIPADKIKPAIPGSVIVYCGTEITRIWSAIWNVSVRQLITPGSRYHMIINKQISAIAISAASAIAFNAFPPSVGLIVL